MKKIKMASLVAFVAINGVFSTVSASELEIHSSITAVSNYVSRGMTQTSKKGAIQADITAVYGGFFAGTWASNVDFVGVKDTDVEVDLYAGYANSYEDLSYSISYFRYMYGSKIIDDLDELRFTLDYNIDKFTIGAKYDMGTWTERNSKKLDYKEINASYDFGPVVFSVAAGDAEGYGDNVTVGLSKAGKFADTDVEFRLKYSDFNADISSHDEHNLWGEVAFTF